MKNELKTAFDNVHAEQSLKDDTRRFLREKTNMYSAKKKHTNRFLRAGISFACVAIISLGFGGHYLYFTPVSAISLDVNPSVELNVNRFDKVVSVDAYNDDGKELSELIDVKYMNYSDALDKLISSDSIEKYIDNGDEVSITVSGNTDEKSEEMLNSISGCDYAKQSGVTCSSENKEQAEEAHNAGLSLGKYKAYLELSELDPNVKPEDVQGLTMREIREMIENCNSNSDDETHSDELLQTDTTSSDDSCNSSGNCQGNGQGKNQNKGNGNGNGYGKHNNQS